MRKNKLLLLLALLMTAATGAWAQDTYKVSLKDGVKDADKWTISPNPAPEGSPVTIQYTGRLKVKGVKATSEAAPAEASVPDGALSGKFSVSDTKQVYFSKGNLQATYNGSNWSWAFAEHQWDYIGNAAGNTKVTESSPYISENATVDLFGWVGAACAWTGAAQYGISNVKTAAQYGYVEGEALKSDWGTLAITNGGNTANFGWRTLTAGDDSGEWEYLFKTRTTPSGVRYAHATVNSVPGLVLLPDDWSTDYYSLNKVNDANGTAYTDNVISSSDWTSKLEAHGAVFLPAGGNRNAAEVSDAGVGGTYWSSTSSTTVSALGFRFASTKFGGGTQGFTRNRGLSVRLVREVATTDAPAAKPAATVTTAPTGAAIVGVGKSTELVSGGVADGGTLMYAVTTTNTKPTSTAGFSDAVPTAKDITASGTVYVWYYVKADDTHSDSEIAGPVSVTLVEEITWDGTNISDLRVMGTFESYAKDGVTLSANAEMNQARWRDKGDPTTSGIQFDAMESGGYTFTAPTGKKFTKIVMTLTFFAGWDNANLGSGWSYSGDDMTEIYKVTWTGTAASTVGLLTGADHFSGERVKSIVFYLSE